MHGEQLQRQRCPPTFTPIEQLSVACTSSSKSSSKGPSSMTVSTVEEPKSARLTLEIRFTLCYTHRQRVAVAVCSAVAIEALRLQLRRLKL